MQIEDKKNCCQTCCQRLSKCLFYSFSAFFALEFLLLAFVALKHLELPEKKLKLDFQKFSKHLIENFRIFLGYCCLELFITVAFIFRKKINYKKCTITLFTLLYLFKVIAAVVLGLSTYKLALKSDIEILLSLN